MHTTCQPLTTDNTRVAWRFPQCNCNGTQGFGASLARSESAEELLRTRKQEGFQPAQLAGFSKWEIEAGCPQTTSIDGRFAAIHAWFCLPPQLLQMLS